MKDTIESQAKEELLQTLKNLKRVSLGLYQKMKKRVDERQIEKVHDTIDAIKDR